MDLGIEGRVALVGASSKGLGRAAAEELAAEGCDVVICARGAEALEATRRDIEQATSRRVVAVTADLSRAEGTERVLAAALDAFGHVDILVTNTGGPPAGPFESHSIEAWQAATDLLLLSAVRLIHGVLPGMKERGWGRIIGITSIAAKQPVENLVLSNSVRAAVTGLAKTLSNEIAGHGITVNTVLPGYTATDRVAELAERNAALHGTTPEQEKAKWAKQSPVRRIGEPREFAAAVAFLASARASYITGVALQIDGGEARGLL